jgi:hypothetical protein
MIFLGKNVAASSGISFQPENCPLERSDEFESGQFLSELLKKCPNNFLISGQNNTTVKIYPGDLIFQRAVGREFSEAVARSGGNNNSVTHVGIVSLLNTMIESAGSKVSRVKICDYLGRPSTVNLLVRVRDRTIIQESLERAESFLGRPYNPTFYPNSEGLYCSELVMESFLRKNGSHHFAQKPMKFETTFWDDYFESLGVPIPHNVLGSHPQGILDQKELLEEIAEIKEEITNSVIGEFPDDI